MNARCLLSVALVASLPACALVKSQDVTKDVGFGMILPPGAMVHEPQENQEFMMPVHLNPELRPEFPDIGLREHDPRRVCIEIVIDESGKVESAVELYNIPDCQYSEGEIEREFIEESLVAAQQWRFKPAAICTLPLESIELGVDCDHPSALIEELAVKLAFVFTFEVTPEGSRVKHNPSY